MSSQVTPPNTEAAILSRLLQLRENKSREVAEYLVEIDFETSDIERMNLLSERAP